MDDRIKELLSQTQDMVRHIEDATYEELEAFTESREKLISSLIELEMQGQIDLKAYQPTIEEILSYDAQLLARMNELKQQASEELIKFQTTKKQKNGYDNAYNADSFFYDKKK
jgi:DNA repair ATPase RecN